MVLLFVLSVMFLFATILFYPKSDEKEDVFAQVTLAVLTIMELHTVWGYITLELLQIGFELDYYARYNFCATLVVLLYWILVKGRKVQKFKAPVYMWVTAGLLFAVTAFIGVWRYGPKLNLFAYCSADSANHLGDALNIFQYGSIGHSPIKRYFLHLNEALLFNCVVSMVQPMSYYRVFLLCELGFFYLSGGIFYTLLQKYIDTRRKAIVGIVFVFLYVFGYPFNNLLYGYEYLGASVTIAGHIVYLLERFVKPKKIQWDIFALLIIACFAMYKCYSLLFIGILLGVCILFLMHMAQRPIIFKWIIFLTGGCIIFYKFDWIYGIAKKMIEQIGTEASMYRNLWANFLWFVPFMVIGIYILFKVLRCDAVIGILIGIVIVMVGFVILLKNEQISSYYYYKFYYLLWLVVLYIASVGAIMLSSGYTKFFLIYTMMIVSLVGIKKMARLHVTQNDYYGIYEKNSDIFLKRICNMDSQRQELFYAAASKAAEIDGVIPYIGEWEMHWGEYYYALTNQVIFDVSDVQRWYIRYDYSGVDEGINQLLEQYIYQYYENVPYITVEKGSEAYWYGIGYYSNLEVVYENEYGFLYKR